MPVATLLLLTFAAAQNPLRFTDQTSQLGLTQGDTSACWVDVDHDGWTDLCAGGVVWLNKQGVEFAKLADVPPSVAADFDNDGYPDFFSCASLKLYRNVQGKSFTEVELPKLPATVSRGACWGDFNGDAFADLYIGGYEDWNTQTTYPSIILTNKAGKSFDLTWSEARFRARGITACDFDRDKDLDVYVSNYRLQPNLLWVNDGRGVFSDRAADKNAVATSAGFPGGHSIGACWGDFDEDGEFDLLAGNFAHVDNRGDQPKSRFLRNQGRGFDYRFEDKGPCGIHYQESYASPAAGDFDNDGRLDLFFTTVYHTASFGKKNFPTLFRNLGGFKVEDVTAAEGLAGLGATYQAAWADFDRDGDLDLVSNGKLFVNGSKQGNWLEVRLIGDGKVVNRSAIGTQVRIALKDRTLTRQVEAGTGEGNQNDLTLHFGLGSHAGPVDLQIAWPNGKRQTLRRVKQKGFVDVLYGK